MLDLIASIDHFDLVGCGIAGPDSKGVTFFLPLPLTFVCFHNFLVFFKVTALGDLESILLLTPTLSYVRRTVSLMSMAT